MGRLIIAGMSSGVRRCWLVGRRAAGEQPVCIGGAPSGASGRAGGGKVDSLGCRGLRSRGCWTAIVRHIHGFFTVSGGGRLVVGERGGLSPRRRDWSSPAF